MSKRPPASVHLHLLSLGDVDVMCKAKKPASMSVMQYACKGVLKCAYLNLKLRELESQLFLSGGHFGFEVVPRPGHHIIASK